MLRDEDRIAGEAPGAGRQPGRPRGNRKQSYVVPCPSAFRDAVLALAERRKVNVGDLARSVLLLLPRPTIDDFPDPGEPTADDRESVILKSGPSANKPWRRKPRLQARLPAGYRIGEIRRALGLALALEGGGMALTLEAANSPRAAERLKRVEAENERLRGAVMALAFEPLPLGVRGRADALHVLGFPPNAMPEQSAIRARFRMLAMVHHPDSGFGHHERMTQLNAALSILRAAR